MESCGDGVDACLAGAREVIINPGWTGGNRPGAGNEFRILGLPDDGTFAERVKVPGEPVGGRNPRT